MPRTTSISLPDNLYRAYESGRYRGVFFCVETLRSESNPASCRLPLISYEPVRPGIGHLDCKGVLPFEDLPFDAYPVRSLPNQAQVLAVEPYPSHVMDFSQIQEYFPSSFGQIFPGHE